MPPSVNPEFAAKHIAGLLKDDPAMAGLIKKFIGPNELRLLFNLPLIPEGTLDCCLRVDHGAKSRFDCDSDVTLEIVDQGSRVVMLKVRVSRDALLHQVEPTGDWADPQDNGLLLTAKLVN